MLPLDMSDAGDQSGIPVRRANPLAASSRGRRRYRVWGNALANRGWPPGTELVLTPLPRPTRRQPVVMDDGERFVAGVFDVRFGRAVLHSEHGSVWVGPGVRWYAVRVAAPPLPDATD